MTFLSPGGGALTMGPCTHVIKFGQLPTRVAATIMTRTRSCSGSTTEATQLR